MADMTVPYDFLFRFLLIGDSGVGKSCLLLRFADDMFSESFVSTIGVDFKIRTMQLADGKIAKLQLWDTAGQERFRTITASYYRGAHAVLICFSDRASFQGVHAWADEARSRSGNENLRLILVATKTDQKDREVSSKEGRALAADLGCEYVETSAKNNVGVDDAFSLMAEELAELHAKRPHPTPAPRPLPPKSSSSSVFSCCRVA